MQPSTATEEIGRVEMLSTAVALNLEGWTQGPSLDGKGRYKAMLSEPLGEDPTLQKPRSDSGAQTDPMGVGSSIAAAANDLISDGSSAAS